jgi:hypothetical protein
MTNQTASFGINDLRTMLNLINVFVARGAIKPNELTTVGELHDKLSNFLATADAAAKAAAEQRADQAEGDTAQEETING